MLSVWCTLKKDLRHVKLKYFKMKLQYLNKALLGGLGGGVQMSLVWKSVWLFSILKSRTCPCKSFLNSSLCCFSTFHLVSFCCRLSKSPLLFFSGWLCHFKGPFIPVSFSIHWSKILWVRPHDNWLIGQWVIFHTTPDTAHVNPFFPKWIYNMIQIHSGETSRPWDFVTRLVAARPHALKLISLTFKKLREVNL